MQNFISQLKQSATGTTKLIVTGHSLGGALSPTVAKWAKETLSQIDNRWTNQIFAMPTAGPSPGNAVYAANWDSAFPLYPITVSSGNIVNRLNTLVWHQWDVVPHAWNYIYKFGNVSASDNYYFWNYSPTISSGYSASTQMGQLQMNYTLSSAGLLAAIDTAYVAGLTANMASTSQKILITGSWPISILSKGQISSFGPISLPITDPTTFLTALGNVHVWGYSAAFNLGINIFQNIGPHPAN